MVPGMLLVPGGPPAVGITLPKLVCTIGDGIGALVIEGGVDVGETAALLLTLEPGDTVTLTVGVPGGRVIAGRFETPLHMF